jgi:hypothetical protein
MNKLEVFGSACNTRNIRNTCNGVGEKTRYPWAILSCQLCDRFAVAIRNTCSTCCGHSALLLRV